ncbi:LysR family transcriptional regulator [Dickeya solani]|uniref:RuBisCO operon transcriptional regulator, putative n=1 Tax=Dickeya solani D s0432-1 TaxID=1231725 RepID=A0AAV3K6H9_9GAMM|nr:LysR family transcriptional regulator [Dickeya solani]ANE74287.1 LysR family transcriptional regulator [Dickeya solani IPO 2222]AUC41499.1 Transcriptional regulator, LysR family [Dickeya solani RNS 08.23.3.1.A]AUH10300.1 LysR family transcriptional regulator [Dickeya solani D s0432-1]AUH14242.1 LysR family transcriptional regulator [Dickeya solani]AYQ48745.1 HTH-type transcriptional activator AllS [Dickeya solani]
MLDGVSLDQLRTFITAVDEGSFSAAARRLRRAQSAISELVRSLEEQLDVTLFDRTGRYPRLTPVGTALLANARDIVAGVDAMKSRAKGMAAGLEPELTIVVDVFYPIDVLTNAAKAFREQFPNVPLRIYVEALGAAYQPVLDRHASVGIVSFLPVTPPGIVTEPLGRITLAMVAAADHPLAAFQGPIPRQELARHVQLVLTDRSEHSRGREFGVMSPKTWRLADLFAKHAFLLNGLGWGGMPMHTIQSDLDSGRLVKLTIEDEPVNEPSMLMSAVYRIDNQPGPAGRWLIEHMTACSRHRSA